MVVTEAGIEKAAKFVHPENADEPMLVIVSGSVTVCNFVREGKYDVEK